ncbi:MAG: hypothetical protein GX654_13225 [Desulfatiglans sp.]|nr:hypothetical protein [Desulfatiglans sp.]
MSIDDNQYIKGIMETGFGLEYTVSKSLLQNGWTVINNKYYIDDVQGAAREIDILAYKVALKKGILIYTVLIISCKKSSENAWALLTKEKKQNDPNIDWNPVTIWSNEKIIKLMLENYEWKSEYVNSSEKLDDLLFSPRKHIFAFQELSKKNGKPQNDKAIFNSVVSSMKSQNYEIESLVKRKKENSFYNFNLVSVVDGPLLRIDYDDIEPNIEHISTDIYVGSYIINRKETLSRVHFITAKAFESCLPTYDMLHYHNIKQAFSIYKKYFIDCIKDEKKIELLLTEFNKSVRWEIYKVLRDQRNYKQIKDVTRIFWDSEKDRAAIIVDGVWEAEDLKALNYSIELGVVIKDALKKIYQYEGAIFFDYDIPF